jgi:hypothetical protein
MNAEQRFGKRTSWPVLRYFIRSAWETAENHKSRQFRAIRCQYMTASYMTMGTEEIYRTLCISKQGRAIVQAVSCWLPTAAARVGSQVIWEFWQTKWHRSRFLPSASVSPANSHSNNCFIFINHPIIDAIYHVIPNIGRAFHFQILLLQTTDCLISRSLRISVKMIMKSSNC